MTETRSPCLIRSLIIQKKWFDKIALKEAISDLEEREKLIVYLRYYKDQTQSEVAERLGISQVQVSRLEKKY